MKLVVQCVVGLTIGLGIEILAGAGVIILGPAAVAFWVTGKIWDFFDPDEPDRD